jgi:hypothetical protein
MPASIVPTMPFDASAVPHCLLVAANFVANDTVSDAVVMGQPGGWRALHYFLVLSALHSLVACKPQQMVRVEANCKLETATGTAAPLTFGRIYSVTSSDRDGWVTVQLGEDILGSVRESCVAVNPPVVGTRFTLPGTAYREGVEPTSDVIAIVAEPTQFSTGPLVGTARLLSLGGMTHGFALDADLVETMPTPELVAAALERRIASGDTDAAMKRLAALPPSWQHQPQVAKVLLACANRPSLDAEARSGPAAWATPRCEGSGRLLFQTRSNEAVAWACARRGISPGGQDLLDDLGAGALVETAEGEHFAFPDVDLFVSDYRGTVAKAGASTADLRSSSALAYNMLETIEYTPWRGLVTVGLGVCVELDRFTLGSEETVHQQNQLLCFPPPAVARKQPVRPVTIVTGRVDELSHVDRAIDARPRHITAQRDYRIIREGNDWTLCLDSWSARGKAEAWRFSTGMISRARTAPSECTLSQPKRDEDTPSCNEDQIRAVVGVLAGRLGRIGSCLKRETTRAPQELPEVLDVSFVARARGLVEEIDFNGGSYRSGALSDCMLNALNGLRMHPAVMGSCQMKLPLKTRD